MTAVEANGITLEYEECGAATAPAILLVNGLGVQLTWWPRALIAGLAGAGYRVLRFDNRDVGLSSRIAAAGMPDLAAAQARLAAGERPEAPYLLDDMAADAAALLAALGLDQVHVVGTSMGGMIAQIMAARHAGRVKSLVSVMSSSGAPGLPQAAPEVAKALLAVPESTAREARIAHGVELIRVLAGAPGPGDRDALRRHVARNLDRADDPAGRARQYLAILASGSRLELLASIAQPTTVIHGRDDPLILLEAGRDTAARIPGARLEIIEGMGHFLAPHLAPALVAAILAHCRAAEAA